MEEQAERLREQYRELFPLTLPPDISYDWPLYARPIV